MKSDVSSWSVVVASSALFSSHLDVPYHVIIMSHQQTGSESLTRALTITKARQISTKARQHTIEKLTLLPRKLKHTTKEPITKNQNRQQCSLCCFVYSFQPYIVGLYCVLYSISFSTRLGPSCKMYWHHMDSSVQKRVPESG
jgi:hypothetical protein